MPTQRWGEMCFYLNSIAINHVHKHGEIPSVHSINDIIKNWSLSFVAVCMCFDFADEQKIMQRRIQGDGLRSPCSI